MLFFAGSFQTGAPPTQGRAGAESQLVAKEGLHHAIVIALVPNAEFNLKIWVKMSPAERTYFNKQPRLHPAMIFVPQPLRLKQWR
jgi:hypothetical protein